MNEELLQEVKTGLVQFMGAILADSQYDSPVTKQLICAALLEEVLNMVKIEDKYELYACKPVLRATLLILEQRKQEYLENISSETAPEITHQIRIMINNLGLAEKVIETLIESIKLPKKGENNEH